MSLANFLPVLVNRAFLIFISNSSQVLPIPSSNYSTSSSSLCPDYFECWNDPSACWIAFLLFYSVSSNLPCLLFSERSEHTHGASDDLPIHYLAAQSLTSRMSVFFNLILSHFTTWFLTSSREPYINFPFPSCQMTFCCVNATLCHSSLSRTPVIRLCNLFTLIYQVTRHLGDTGFLYSCLLKHSNPLSVSQRHTS